MQNFDQTILMPVNHRTGWAGSSGQLFGSECPETWTITDLF